MKITLIQIDKTQEVYLSEGIAQYFKRLSNYITFDLITINVPKNLRQRSEGEQKSEEAKLIFAKIETSDVLVLLDENGKVVSSRAFSQFIGQQQNASVKHLVFLIGGPFGFDQRVYDRANFKVALSAMTFSHQMVRLFFLEQLYRAFTILKGEKYHHD